MTWVSVVRPFVDIVFSETVKWIKYQILVTDTHPLDLQTMFFFYIFFFFRFR